MPSKTRPVWPAYPLSVLVPGVGHWYLGLLRRGALWFGLYLLALAFLSARSLSAAFDPGEPFVFSALQVDAVSYADIAVPLAVVVICLLDVYLLRVGRQIPRAEEP